MNNTILALALAGSTMALGGCVTDGHGDGYGYSSVGWGTPYAYDGWYDGYYGSIHDGYWGSDDYFYYRNSDRDRRYRRGDRNHIMRSAPQGQHRYQQFRGEMRPQQGMKMPMWRGGGDHRGGDHRGGGRGPGRGRR